jgi:hypothetical protein
MHFNLTVKNEVTGVESVCSGEFPPEEASVLREFHECSVAISSAEMLKTGWKSSPLGWSKEGGFYSDDKTSISKIRELLHLLRPVILQSERTNFNKIINVLSRRMENEGVRSLLKRWKDGFSQKISQSAFTITANGLVLNSDEAFFLWLNAFEYHKDKDKQAEFKKALGALPFEIAMNIFTNSIVEKIDATSRLAKFIWDLEHSPPGDPVGMLGGRHSW